MSFSPIRLVGRLLLLLLLLSGSSHAADFSGQVIDVIDGDSIRLKSQGGTRYKAQLNGLVAPLRKEGIRALRELVAGKWLEVHWDRRDKWRRIVVNLQSEGLDINREMIRLGHAWFYRPGTYPDAVRQAYGEAEDEARAARRGLWAEEDSQPPWEKAH